MQINPKNPLPLFLISLLFSCAIARAQGDESFKPQLLPVTPEAGAAAAKALHGCAPPPAGKTAAGINKNGVYTLTGDLFHNGVICAVVDNPGTEDQPGNIILCKWRNASWKPAWTIELQTAWKFPKGYREAWGRDAEADAAAPFWIIDLQKRPLLAIAADVEKAGQNYYVVLFDSKCERILDTDDSFQQQPAARAGYLITGDASRNKSEWSATYFSRIQNDKFTRLASWEESEPWHSGDTTDMPDDTSHSASSGGNHYSIVLDDDKARHPADYVIFKQARADDDPSPQAQDFTKSFAKIYFTPKKGIGGSMNPEKELAYIFEKLTGIPRELYPPDSDTPLNGKIESEGKITIKGGSEALKLFAPAPAPARAVHSPH